MAEKKESITALESKEELNIAAIGVFGAIAGAISAMAITALMDKDGTKKIEEKAEDLTNQGVKIIRSFRKIVEELDNLRGVGVQRIKEGKEDADKYLQG